MSLSEKPTTTAPAASGVLSSPKEETVSVTKLDRP